ncbi:MAG: hypothetical protein HUJ72_09940, partial [Blautia sp.]|nr:hypothetical protein [Blautia sp.]
MNDFRIVEYPFTDTGRQILSSDTYGKDWPVVYMIHNDKELYVGETQNACNRFEQHQKNRERQRLQKIKVVFDREFNKSAILDIEHNLIQLFVSDGKYKLEVVKETDSNKAALRETVANETIQNRMIAILAEKGVDVKFLQENKGFKGRYSTSNAVQTADGLYSLIEILEGERDLIDILAEESGHFAIGALGNNQLVTRLMDTLTPEVRNALFKDEGLDIVNDSKREAAGRLVGRALVNRLEYKPINSLLKRIISAIKRMFYKVTRNDIALLKEDAYSYADKIAEGYISSEFEGNVEEAISYKETRYHSEAVEAVKILNEVLNSVRSLKMQLQAVSSKGSTERMDDMIRRLQSVKITEERMKDITTLKSDITEALADLCDMIESSLNTYVPQLKNIVDRVTATDALFDKNVCEVGKIIRSVSLMVNNSALMVEQITYGLNQSRLLGDVQVLDSFGNVITKDLKDKIDKMTQPIGAMAASVKNLQQKFFLKFLEQDYGKKYVVKAYKAFDASRFSFHVREDQIKTIEDALNVLNDDCGFLTRWFRAIIHQKEVINQLSIDKAKNLKQDCNKQTNLDWERLRSMVVFMENSC